MEVTYSLNGIHRCGHRHSLTGAIDCARSIARHTSARAITARRNDGTLALWVDSAALRIGTTAYTRVHAVTAGGEMFRAKGVMRAVCGE